MDDVLQERIVRDLPDTNHSLIARVKDLADGESWTEFLAIYQPVVLRMARFRGLQDADAQDVMQQVFLSISRSIEDWTADHDQPPFRAWLTTIARNAITKALTRQPRDGGTGSTSVAELLNNHPAHEDLTADILAEARKELVRWASEQVRFEFSEETWKAFWMTSIDGQSVAEAVKATGRSSGSIYVARYRVIARLKEKIREASQLWDLQDRKS